MKRIISALCAAVLIINTSAFAGHIYSYEENVPISKSISLTKVKSFYSDHNISYCVIKADLSDPDTGLKLLTPEKGIDKLDTVTNLAKTDENIVAALNADFFSWHQGNSAFSMGMEIVDGKLVSSPIEPSTMATIAYMNDAVSMSYLDFHIMAVAPNGQYQEIRHLNKHTSYYGDMLMYTKEFNGGMSPAPGGEVVEVVVSGNEVTEFRRNMPPVEIPEDGCVLVVSEGSTMFLANNFQVGDVIKFDYYMTPYLFDAETAFGGGAMLVYEGKAVTSYSHTVAGNHPRSAIGIDKDGKTLYLVAVDGRQDSSLGMRMSALASLMIELGCYTAVNLDGGGSTNMVASTAENKNIQTVNSPSENRSVINAVGLSYTGEGTKAEGIILKKDKDTVFIGDSVLFSASVYDENMRPFSAPISWQAEGGRIEDGVFTATDGGLATVSAKSGELDASDEVFVIDTVSGINLESYITLTPGSSASLGISVFDREGHFSKISNTAPFEITSSDPSIVSVSGQTVTGVGEGRAIVTVKKDGAVSYCSVLVGDGEHLIAPENVYADERPDANGNVRIGAVHSGDETLLSRLIDNRIKTIVSQSSSNALAKSEDGFSSKEDANALYINLDTSKGGIRSTNSSQWDSLASAIAKTGKRNVFIMSESSIFGTSEFENTVLTDYLASCDKNVFVICGGVKNTYKNIDGVGYFTIGNSKKTSLSPEYLRSFKYLEFNVDEDVTTFAWKSVF